MKNYYKNKFKFYLLKFILKSHATMESSKINLNMLGIKARIKKRSL